MKTLFFTLALWLTASVAFAGYTIFEREQTTPQYISVQGAYGPESRLNPGTPPAYPATFIRMVCRVDGFDLYSSSPGKRLELWEDTAGTATGVEIFAQVTGVREWKAKQIRAEGARRLESIASPYMLQERETWAIQMKEAEAYLFDPVNTQTPMLSAIAANRGLTVPDLVGLVWENVTLFRQAAGAVLGTQQALLDRVYSESDFSAFLGVAWP